MGEVYRAEDNRLGRAVAVKVLSAAFTANAERLARFEREARVLAGLSHPNVAAVHDVGEEGGIHFLVMELVPGVTLAERLAAGRLPVDEAIAIAIQIADALEAAHTRAIVHRDLKPANVMVDPDGRVKVLDFGLAKALDPASSGAGDPAAFAHSPTLTLQATTLGTLLGTAAYMSPEQARGQPADKRSDIWSFGVVLWEMLTGRRLFAGETTSDVLAAVLRAEPDLAALPPETPRPIRRLLSRCLVRDPRRRLHDVADARLDLVEASEGAPALLGEPPAERALASGRRSWVPWGIAGLLATGLLVMTMAFWHTRSRPAPRELLRLPLQLPAGYQVLNSERGVVAMSLDGRRQAVVAVDADGTSRIVLRDLESLEPVPLPGTEGASTPFFSPDGGTVAYFGPDGALMKIDVGGLRTTRILPKAITTTGFNRGAAWTEDGWIVTTQGFEGGLVRIRAGGGPPDRLTELDEGRDERTHRWPFALPGRAAVVFTSDTSATTEYYDDARIEVVDLETRERKTLIEGASRAVTVPGFLVYANGGSLFAVPFDTRSLKVSGNPVPVLQGVLSDPSSGAVHFAVSARGDLLYAPGDRVASVAQPYWIERDGSTSPSAIGPDRHEQLALAPDGRHVALSVADDQQTDIWIADLARQTLSRLTFDGGEDPVWAPDGRRVFFDRGDALAASGGGRSFEVLSRPADGSADATAVWTHDRPVHPSSITADGRALLVEFFAGPENGDVWLVPVAGGEPRPLLSSRIDEFMATMSPDGRWVAYTANDTGTYEIYVRSASPGGGRWQISAGGGAEPRWSGDGRELYYRQAGAMMAVSIEPGESLVAGLPTRLFSGLRESEETRSYSVAKDGRFLVLSTPVNAGRTGSVALVLGWSTELATRENGHPGWR